MTSIEKFTLESTAATCASAAGVLLDVGTIFNLLSANLPNLSVRDRDILVNEASGRLGAAHELQASAKKLRALLGGNQAAADLVPA